MQGDDFITNTPFISVIIPTFNRARLLPLTLDSFLMQTYPNDKFEIIISDNNSSDNTKEVLQDYLKKVGKKLSYIFEPKQGVHYARNTAAKAAVGDILYFTDDDMIADPDLLRNLVRVFSLSEKVAVAGGKILPKWEAVPPAWLQKLCNNNLLSLLEKPEELVIAPYDIGVFSCHQAIRRDVFFAAGGFNPENTAGEWIGDGETGLNEKIKGMGYHFAYVGNSLIHHIIPPSRMDQAYLNKRLSNQGNCDSYSSFRRNDGKKITLLPETIKCIWGIIASSVKAFVRFICRSDAWRLNWAWIFYFYSRAKYNLRLMFSCEWRKMVLKDDWL